MYSSRVVVMTIIIIIIAKTIINIISLMFSTQDKLIKPCNCKYIPKSLLLYPCEI